MNYRFVNCKLAFDEMGCVLSLSVYVTSSRGHAPTRADTIYFSGLNRSEVAYKFTQGFRQVLSLLSEHHFFVPTAYICNEDGDDVFATPYALADEARDAVRGNEVAGLYWFGIPEVFEFCEGLKHYGRKY